MTVETSAFFVGGVDTSRAKRENTLCNRVMRAL